MAAEGGGADLKALDEAKKLAQATMKKYKAWGKYTKKNPKHKERKACAKNLKSGNNALVQALEKCGYHDVCFYHTPTGVCQAGSFQPAWAGTDKAHLGVGDEVYDVCVQDTTGYLLPPEDENCMQNCTDKETLTLLREIATDAEKRAATLNIPFRGRGWKVIKKEERKNEGGAIMIALSRKQESLLKPGYIKCFDDWENNCDYWQLYGEDGAAVEGAFTYAPNEAFDVEVGASYSVMTSKKDFDALGVSSHTPFTTQEAWDEMCRNCLGWECTVEAIHAAADGWNGYNVDITCANGTSATLPIRALRKENDGDTALFMAEVGMFVFIAEMDLFENKGYCERGKQMQPLASEWTSICYHFGGDELGFGEFLDDEESPAWVPAIKAFLDECETNGTEYGDLGFGMD